ncbi:hypothetical protein JQ625_27260 [Bradyrhizobium diazoefficiens]|nr:hypothetical protein [Bradyrhizobium diazoefficiens]MBR0778548.1 hypothetical protein [Bradyrhizobium diazoefficiens]
MPKPSAKQPQGVNDLSIDTVEEIYQRRIAGVSTKRIAEHFKLDEKKVMAVLKERTQGVLSKENLIVTIGLESERLDRNLEAIWPACEKGDPVAIALAVKLAQRRAVLMGIDAPQSHSVKLYQSAEPRPLNSTETLAAQIESARAAPDSKARAAVENLRVLTCTAKQPS